MMVVNSLDLLYQTCELRYVNEAILNILIKCEFRLYVYILYIF